MELDVLPGATNVVRFPVELRAMPSLEILRLLACARDDAIQMADLYGLDVEWNMRDRVGAEVHGEASRLCRTGSQDLDMAARVAALESLLAPLLADGVALCRAALEVSGRAEAARRRLGGVPVRSWLHEELRDRADALTGAAMAASVDAYHAVEEVEGVARALALVRAGEAWSPRPLGFADPGEAEAWEWERLFLSEEAA